uniref:uncharacterized protein n=1 Tax=Myxine glutinosa TaxID=7769 RepID=UPI00358F650E
MTPVDEQQSFLKLLSTNEFPPVALSLFSPISAAFESQRILPPTPHLPLTLRSHYKETNKQLHSAELKRKCEELATSLAVNRSESEFLEQKTRLQAKTTIWHEHRAGRITASSAHTILHTNQDSPAPSAILRLTKPNHSEIHSAPLIYGHKKEPEVFQLAGQLLGQYHENCELSHCGMVICEDKPWLSASVDGIVKCSCHGTRILEIKCPYSARDKEAEEFVYDKASYMYDGHLEEEHQYYTQVQLEIYVHNVQACDFVVYVKDSLLHQTIVRNDMFLSKILPMLEGFWKRHITHELLTRCVEHANARVKRDERIYCYCRKKWDGVSVLVGCDGWSCPFEWVHLNGICPARKTAPKGTWYCKKCCHEKEIQT